jgi:hypothetical protein
MRKHVDEAGRDRLAFRVDDELARMAALGADIGNAIAENRDLALIRAPPGTVINDAVGYHNVE